MFARLTGKIDEITSNAVIVDVGGVGYFVTCSGRTLAQLGSPGDFVRLYIETQVREDAINLYGFADADEQAWFKLLTTVQGVGARVGMAILSVCSGAQIAAGIASQDKGVFTAADGVGPKLGTRIVTELKDKIPESMMMGAAVLPTKKGAKIVAGPMTGTPVSTTDADAVSALVNLGYTRVDAFSAIMRIRAAAETDMAVGDLIRLGLSELSKVA